jgi:pyruvate dehydrogenase E1 component alpha subunit
MLGGFGIVAGQIPIATGAAFSCKYLKSKDEISVCFFGDGAVANGVFHECLNIASMWELPCMYVIENNKWSMGTPLCRTMANYRHFPEKAAASYGMQYFRLDGMNLLNCYAGFQEAYQYILKKGKPVLIECMTERFRGHSISDPGHYRSKEEVKVCMEKDPIHQAKMYCLQHEILTEDEFKKIEADCREEILEAVRKADGDPWPDPQDLEKGVFAQGDVCR